MYYEMIKQYDLIKAKSSELFHVSLTEFSLSIFGYDSSFFLVKSKFIW